MAARQRPTSGVAHGRHDRAVIRGRGCQPRCRLAHHRLKMSELSYCRPARVATDDFDGAVVVVAPGRAEPARRRQIVAALSA